MEKGGCHVNIPQQGKASFFAHENLTMEFNQKKSQSDKITHMQIFDYAVLSFLYKYKCVHCICRMLKNSVIFQLEYSSIKCLLVCMLI